MSEVEDVVRFVEQELMSLASLAGGCEDCTTFDVVARIGTRVNHFKVEMPTSELPEPISSLFELLRIRIPQYE